MFQNKDKQIYIEKNQSFSKTQGSVIGKSFGFAALGFLLIAAVSLIFSAVWKYAVFKNGISFKKFNTVDITITVISVVLLLASSIMSMFWQMKIMTMQKTSLTWFVWGFFIIAQGLSFSWLMFMLSNATGQSLWWVCPTAFGAAFFLFGLCAIFGYFLSLKGLVTINKIMTGISIAMVLLMLPLFVLTFVAAFKPETFGNLIWIEFLIGGLFIFMLLLSVVNTVSDIRRSSEFAQLAIPKQGQKEVTNRLGLIYGFNLLVTFIIIVWWLIWMILRILSVSRRR